MDEILIKGNGPINGVINISGAKNAALPILAATILIPGKVDINNVPKIQDIESMYNLLQAMGVVISTSGESTVSTGSLLRKVEIDAQGVNKTEAPYDMVRKMRASILVLGPLLARFGSAKVSLPGGCAIGDRPVDIHLQALAAMGADIVIESGYITATAPHGLHGAIIYCPKVSVGATENIMMAASLASGTTIIQNAAQEPEISDLANFLRKAGAEIVGDGTRVITIQGVERLRSLRYTIMSDRIEAGTYAIAGAITGGSLRINNIDPKSLIAFLDVLQAMNICVDIGDNYFDIRTNGKLNAVHIETGAYPSFPTDLQAQIMALMCVAEGESILTEHIFENRMMHVSELKRMKANIELYGNKAIIHGSHNFKFGGAPVMATDLRASACLVLAGLAAEGRTLIRRVYHLDRGYELMQEKLKNCGASIERINEIA